MLRVLKKRASVLCDRISRREWLEVGGLGLFGLGLPTLLRAEAARRAAPLTSPSAAGGGSRNRSAPAKSCILVVLSGGPSQLDMWDMKPEAPAEIRGEFRPISTSVPGIQFSEHLPEVARQAHRLAVVRSAHHNVFISHAAATHFALTGNDHGDVAAVIGASPKDHPAIGSVLTLLRPPDQGIVPYVSLPYITAEGNDGPPQPGVFGGWLGRAFDPLFVLSNSSRCLCEGRSVLRGDPKDPDFQLPALTLTADVTHERLNARIGLLDQISAAIGAFDRSDSVRALSGFQERAFGLLVSALTPRAFDLGEEPESVRDRYGRNVYGQSMLLTRRLIEAGTRMVTLKWGPDANCTWDTHQQNFVKLKSELLPQLDASLSSLIEDLAARGLLDETLVVVMGEFGRTPKVNKTAGRDHWSACYSLLFAGGGTKGGLVLGSSDKIAAYPADTPVTPLDIVATIYTALGVPPETELRDQLGRPLRLVSEGRVLTELLA
jgi:hypothetical protein